MHPHRVRKNRWHKIKRDIGLLEGQKARYAKYPRGQGWRTGHENPWHFSRENLWGLTSFNPKHKKGIALIILLSLGILFTVDQALKNPTTGHSPIDPLIPIWSDNLAACANGSPPGWVVRDSVQTHCWAVSPASYNGITVKANATYSGVAISKQHVDLSTAASKALDLYQAWKFNDTSGCCTNMRWGFFLTRNGTIPTLPAYDPLNDPNVALVIEVLPGTNGMLSAVVWTQRDPTITVASQDAGCTASGGSIFLCGPQVTTTIDTNTAQRLRLELAYNKTATSSVLSSLFYWAATPPAQIQTSNLPWFNFQSQQYYWGLWNKAVSGAVPIDFLATFLAGPNLSPTADNSLLASVYIAPPAGSAPVPYLDTSGFFGPIIKALVSIGVFILNAILTFIAFITPALQIALSFLETFYTTLINVIGNLIWPGSNLGTALASMLSAILNFMVNVVPPALGNVVAIFSRYVDGASVLLTWGAIPLNIALNVLLVGINTISFGINLISMLTKIWGVLLFTMLVIFYFGDVGDYGLSGFQAWFETVKWLVFGLGIRPLFMILDYMIDIITAIIGFIPKPFVQMVAHKFPRLPIVDITGNPTWPSFELDELRRGNIFSVGGFLIGTVALVWYETTSLPGSITALVPGVGTTLTNLNGLTNLSLLFVELFGFCVIFLLPGKMIHAVTGLAVNPPWGENLAFQTGRSVSVRGTSIRVQRKPKKHFQGRLEKKVAKLKGTMSEKQKEEAVSKAFAEAAKKQQAEVEVQKARETGERIAKEELKRREDERQRQERIAQVGE